MLARNGWPRGDPLADTDSPNLYAFVGWQPTMATDPLGMCGIWDTITNEANCRDYFIESFKEEWDKDKEAVSTAVSFIPGLGDLKDAQEAITGVDLITGEKLSWMERGITVAAAFIPVVGGKALRELAGEAAERGAKEGADALGEGLERGLKEGTDAAGEGAERAARQGADAIDDVSRHAPSQKLDDGATCPFPVTPRCFAAGTLVSTSEGLMPIEEVEVGDQVFAYDDATGQEHLAEVVALFHRDVEELWILNAGGETIETTDEHPFYVANQGWTQAKDLQAGDILIATGGDRLTLESVERVERPARVYNFEVRDLHSYFVSELGVVVHNCGARPPQSPFYEVGYEAQLKRGEHYPNVSDQRHFQEANRQLHEAMQADAGFAKMMEDTYPGITAGVTPGRRGKFSRRAPTPEVTWHHHPTREGVMQLVPRSHHKAPGPVQNSLHPDGRGGMENWGGGRN